MSAAVMPMRIVPWADASDT
jgi:hypothetical protein